MLPMNRVAFGAAFWALLVYIVSQPTLASAADASLVNLRSDAATVVVKQGNAEITLGDVDTWMLDVPEKDRVGFIRSPERIENMLFQLLIMKQVNLDARAAKLDQQPVIARHMQMASERTLARYQMEASRLAIKVPNLAELAKERYLANPDQFREPDVATVVHLLVAEHERGADAAKKLIDRLYTQAKKNPDKLEPLALKYSDDPSARSNQGRLQDVSLATLDAEFAKATRALEPGQLSPPVKSEFGWHIIRLDAITRGRLPEFDDIKATIIAAAEREYTDRTFQAYVDSLRQRPMEPNAEVLEKLPFRYGGAPEALLPPPAASATALPEAK